jgi:hypothetical protein
MEQLSQLVEDARVRLADGEVEEASEVVKSMCW